MKVQPRPVFRRADHQPHPLSVNVAIYPVTTTDHLYLPVVPVTVLATWIDESTSRKRMKPVNLCFTFMSARVPSVSSRRGGRAHGMRCSTGIVGAELGWMHRAPYASPWRIFCVTTFGAANEPGYHFESFPGLSPVAFIVSLRHSSNA